MAIIKQDNVVRNKNALFAIYQAFSSMYLEKNNGYTNNRIGLTGKERTQKNAEQYEYDKISGFWE